MRCPKCGTEQPEGAIQCGKCHLVFAKAKGPTGAQGPAGDKATQPPVKILRGAGPDKKQLSVRFSGARPKYPPCCACCLEPADAGVYFKFHEGKRLIAAVPACKRCLLHERIGTAAAWVAAVLAALVTLPGMVKWVGGFLGLRLFLFNPWMAAVAVIAWSVILLVIWFGFFRPLVWLLEKKSCAPFDPVDVKFGSRNPPTILFAFGNKEYGQRFVRANDG